ncbi:MAG: mechanosensitive ion channel domain-containing protein, partial [Gammaproteobacteria bacterium]
MQILIDFLYTLGISENNAIIIRLATTSLAIVLFAWLANMLSKRYLAAALRKRSTQSQSYHLRLLAQHNIFHKISHLAPAVIIYLCAPLLIVEQWPLTHNVVSFIKIVTQIYFICTLFFIISAFLNYGEDLYKRLPVAKRRPIKSYIQVVKIILIAIAAIIIVSALLQKSPLVFLTGLGAMTALVSLIFKDTIMGFIASVQLTTYDMVRIGDWIDIPVHGVDGDVIDISLNTIKVQNFDKTIVTLPTTALLTEGVKNWRGMEEAGGRRIKRAIYIDISSICFLSDEELARYRKIQHIEQYVLDKTQEIQAYNDETAVNKASPANGRNLTNIGLFRAYI